ncbi:MAG TPA: hypothetical protein VNZ57_15730 [Longimicrobiales bacterium]|nr:hypothetical protein [Longimicrobiales bacterium]
MFADGWVVNIDENVTVKTIGNNQRSGGTVGGHFVLEDGIEVTCEEVRAHTTDCIVFDDDDGEAVINADLIGGGFGNEANGTWKAPVLLKAGTLTVNGNVGPSSSNWTAGLRAESGTLIINGNVGSFGTPQNATVAGVVKVTAGDLDIIVNGNVAGAAVTANTTTKAGIFWVAGGGTIFIDGDLTGGPGLTSGVSYGIRVESGCTVASVEVTGDVTGAAGSVTSGQGAAISLQHATCIVNVGGNVTAGSATTGNVQGIASVATGSISVGGSVAGGIVTTGNGTGIDAPNADSVTISGDVAGGTTTNGRADGVNAPDAVVDIGGSVYGGTTTGTGSPCGLVCGNSAEIDGDVKGGAVGSTAANPAGVAINGGSLVVHGNVLAGQSGSTAGNAAGIFATAGTIQVDGTVAAGDRSNAICIAGNAVTYTLTGDVIAHLSGVIPVGRGYLFLDESAAIEFELRTGVGEGSTVRKLYTANAFSALPQTKDVRAGVTYGPSGELKGTLAVPPKEAVGAGVPVDDTVGEAALTEVTLQNAIIPIVP